MCCKNRFRPLRMILAFVTFLLSIALVVIYWYAFSQFVKKKSQFPEPDLDRQLTIGLGVLCAVGTLILGLEIKNLVQSCKTYSGSSGGDDDDDDGSSTLDRWQEMTSLLQLLLQDAPVMVIIFMQYDMGNCPLWRRLFDERWVGSLTVIGAMASAVWKIIVSFCDCLCGCGDGGAGDCGWRCCCCLCRWLRSALGFGILGFGTFLLITFAGKGVGVRDTCLTSGGLPFDSLLDNLT